MPNHFKNLTFYIADLKDKKILDIGAGRGKFLVEAALEGAQAYGLEKSPDYIQQSLKRAQENNVKIELVEGLAEKLPLEDNSFDFVNLAEVIEHVEDPEKVLAEIYRVLKDGGQVYMSVPSRFSINDAHYHLYFVNWLPRVWSEFYIKLFNKTKDYSHGQTGRQKLSEMHYYTYGGVKKLITEFGFKIEDMREIKIRRKFPNKFFQWLPLVIYLLIRPFYFKAFHILMTKEKKHG